MNEYEPYYLIYFAVFLQLIGLTFAAFVDPYISKRHKTVILINCLLTFVLIMQNYMDCSFSLQPTMFFQRKVTGIIGYSIRPVILVMWLYLICKNQRLIFAWALVIINALVHLTALFSGVCFTITPENVFERGPLGYTCHMISAVLLVYLFWLSADMYVESVDRKITSKGNVQINDISQGLSSDQMKQEIMKYGYGIEGLLPVACVLIIIISVILDSKIVFDYEPIVFLTIAIVSSNLFYYIWLHLGFVKEHEHDLQAQQRIQIMKSQIQPHFLYNTLSTIQALCLTDPDKAADTAERFGTYLRQNLNSLDQSELIPFEKEMEHTRVYAEIEQIRFPSIEVTYDVKEVEDSGLDIPALTVQPLVENAIRHGVRSKTQGIIHVSASKKESFYVITVEDNGRGFDTEVLKNQDNEHIGIQNVKERLESLCNGKLTVNSRPGEGTMVTIRIPV